MKRTLTAINLILTTMIAFFCVQLFYKITFSKAHVMLLETKTIQYKKSPNHVIGDVKPITAYKTIAQRALFGIQPKEDKQSQLEISVNVDKIDHTDLEIRLWGTVSSKGSSSYAVIESLAPGQRRAKQRLYHVGDTVLSASIEQIYRDKVVLVVDGDRQVLGLEDYQGAQSRRKKRPRQPLPANPRKYNRAIKHQQIENAFENLTAVMKQARIRPHTKGMSISNIRRNSIFQKLGLRNGDVIVGVNGEKMGSVDDALSLYYSLRSGSRVSIDIERRRRPVTINYAIN